MATFSIKSWAEEDRPREKMLEKGCNSLSDAELLAILIGSGSRNETAVGLAQRILADTGNDLNELGKKNLKDLMKFKGVGEAKAISIVAALELGRRRQLTDIKERPTISDSRSAYDAIASKLVDNPHEECWILLTNRANKIIRREQVSSGGVAGTVVDIKIILKKAVEELASGIVLAHNHPSGSLQPSAADIDVTNRLRNAAKLLDVTLLDHLIISEKGYFSFADEGKI